MSKANLKRVALEHAIEDRGLKAVFLDGFDNCIIGSTDLPDGGVSICYDTEKILKSLQKQGMYRHEAQEYFDFNVAGCKFSEGNPIFVDTVRSLV